MYFIVSATTDMATIQKCNQSTTTYYYTSQSLYSFLPTQQQSTTGMYQCLVFKRHDYHYLFQSILTKSCVNRYIVYHFYHIIHSLSNLKLEQTKLLLVDGKITLKFTIILIISKSTSTKMMNLFEVEIMIKLHVNLINKRTASKHIFFPACTLPFFLTTRFRRGGAETRYRSDVTSRGTVSYTFT